MTALVIYATREGQAKRIAEHVAASMGHRGLAVDLIDAAQIPSSFSLAGYSAAVLIASVHLGRHEPEMTSFVKFHVAELEQIPAAFLSVSLSEAGAEDASAPAERRERAASDVNAMIQSFLAETNWRPAKTKALAGALLYTKYNVLLRLVMKHIARQARQDTDTSRDRAYTDWAGLDDFIEEFIQHLMPRPSCLSSSPVA
ncbi:MAG: flavodoxin domain-containing protein [Bryobacteraceae bacterium]